MESLTRQQNQEKLLIKGKKAANLPDFTTGYYNGRFQDYWKRARRTKTIIELFIFFFLFNSATYSFMKCDRHLLIFHQ